MNADLGTVTGYSFRLVFTEPIIHISNMQYATAMCIDMYSLIIRPYFTGNKYAGSLFRSGFAFTAGESDNQ